MTPTRESIIARRKACDLNELAAYRDHAATLLRIRTSREYVQAECEHPVIVSKYEISHFAKWCDDCGVKIR